MTINYSHEPRKHSRNSPVWETWHLVFDMDGIEAVGFFYCIKCHEVMYSAHAVTGSTSQLLRHRCVTIEQKPIQLSEIDRETLKQAAAKFVAVDLRPLRAIECPGLLELVMAGVELGKKFPDMTIEDLKRELPTRNTVRNTLMTEAESSKAAIKELFQKAMKNGGFGCTLDLWSDNYKFNSYLAMTANMYFVENEKVIQKRIVFHIDRIDEIVKSKDFIRAKIIEIFRSYGISQQDIKKYITFTTDR